MDKQLAFAVIKSYFPQVDGKRLNVCTVDLDRKYKIHYELEAKEKVEAAVAKAQARWEKEYVPPVVESNRRKLTDEERTEELTAFLDGKLLDGSLSAAELAQFKDIYGLKAKDRDLTIEIIDFKDAYPEDANEIEVCAEVIRKKIAEANQ